MERYIKNNYNMIKMYNSFYELGIDIEGIKRKINEGYFDNIHINDLYRFRIYLDSCLLLFNKEKVENEYLKKKFSYKDYFNNLLKDPDFKKQIEIYIDWIKKTIPIDININDLKGFYIPFSEEKNIPIYKQLKILRNSFAHMQYGNFIFEENMGAVLFYGIYNKDNGKCYQMGIVVEEMLHQFIDAFFSNNINKGIPYKHTLMSYELDSRNLHFFEITFTSENSDYYTGNNNHLMKNTIFSKQDSNHLNVFLEEHKNEFTKEETIINEKRQAQFYQLLEQELLRKPTNNELIYTIKAFYDIETEFSNFLVHIIQLNDTLIGYKLYKEYNASYTIDDIFQRLDELKEDVDSSVTFKYFFTLLECVNVVIRLEDEDMSLVELETINVDGFKYDSANMSNYINKAIIDCKIPEADAYLGDKYYIIERLRNALAHGNIKLDVDCENHCKVIFSDKWNARNEQLQIPLESLRRFLLNNNWRLDG